MITEKAVCDDQRGLATLQLFGTAKVQQAGSEPQLCDATAGTTRLYETTVQQVDGEPQLCNAPAGTPQLSEATVQ